MARAAIREVTIADQFEVRRYTGDDGYPAADVFSPVAVTTADGRKFFLPMGVKREADDEGWGGWGYAARYDADAMMEKVAARGSIDPDAWVEVEEIDIEDELGPFGREWEREQMGRMGYAA